MALLRKQIGVFNNLSYIGVQVNSVIRAHIFIAVFVEENSDDVYPSNFFFIFFTLLTLTNDVLGVLSCMEFKLMSLLLIRHWNWAKAKLIMLMFHKSKQEKSLKQTGNKQKQKM